MFSHLRLTHIQYLLSILLLIGGSRAQAQVLQFPEASFDAVFPSGGQVGTSVSVELIAPNGLTGAKDVLLEGPPGITVQDVKAVNYNRVTAVFEISPDAAVGPRWVRVRGGQNGLTNRRAFLVGKTPEVVEKEADTPQLVTLPIVVNGQINPTLDVDRFQFQGRAGMRLVASLLAHRLDTLTRQGNNRGFLDASLELLDANGNILASAEDTVGLDPVLTFTLPTDGLYTVLVRSLSFQGFPESVYRLVLGEVPCPIGVFPAGGRRGETIEVELFGPGMPAGTRQLVTVGSGDNLVQTIASNDGLMALPFLRGNLPEIIESINDTQATAQKVSIPVIVNGRFEKPGDEEWYQVELKAGEGLKVETIAQRHLFSPVDTLIEVFDSQGKKLAENDDGRPQANECYHDFASSDSWLMFSAAQAGIYSIRVRNQSSEAGPAAVYRLSIQSAQPDFDLFLWPDAVPVWGPGSTASFVVNVMATGTLPGDVALRVEGLPMGWKSAVVNVPVAPLRIYANSNYGMKSLVTISAPADAVVGTVVPFQVKGVVEKDGYRVEHAAQPLTLLGNSHNDRMHLRYSDQAYAVVASPMDSIVETSITELTVVKGQKAEIPVRLIRAAGAKAQMSVTFEGPTVAARCAWGAPLAVSAEQVDIRLPIQIEPECHPGTYGIVVSRGWASDLRAGRPGPCTPIIKLNVLPAEK